MFHKITFYINRLKKYPGSISTIFFVEIKALIKDFIYNM